MKTALSIVITLVLGAIMGTPIAVAIADTVAHAQVPSTPPSFGRAADARFRLVAEEGIVQPDGRTFITGAKIWTVADRNGQCYVLFLLPGGASATGPTTCP